MDENELEKLNKALKQINRCLDERFEENADLYIAPEQVEDIKKLIYAGNYEKLVKECSPILKKFSPQVMAHVLIKNAWLMRSPKYATLKNIFEACGYYDLKNIMTQGVLDNKIAMPSNFRLFLIRIYLANTPAEICRQMLEDNLTFLKNIELRALCLRQGLTNEPNILNRYKILRKEAKTTPAIYTQVKILAEMFPPAEFTDDFIEAVFDDNLVDESDGIHFWIDTLSAESVPTVMDKFKSYCRLNSSNIRKCREVCRRVFSIGKKDYPVFVAVFADACKCMDGFSKQKSLAEQCLKLTREGTDEETLLKNALENHGFNVNDMEKGDLADLSDIKSALGENYISNGKYNWLVISFHKKYRMNYKDKLDEIMNDINNDDLETAYDHFEEFCCRLVERTELNRQQNIKYMLYVIDNFVDSDDDAPVVERLLNHIEHNNIFATCKKISGIEKIQTFVRKMDFELYCELISRSGG